MAPFAPFEQKPEIAVAVSGGADSLCLAWLAGRWARARGGNATGLVVDHGLRPESAAEAEAATRRLAAFGLAAHILPRRGERPRRSVQAAARALRYDLLANACCERGILHLLLGHHRGDQAETVMLRRAAGSGVRGLAGMAALREHSGLRLLRPLLPVAPARLRATLAHHGHDWMEDPSNRDPAYARTAARQELAQCGGSEQALAADAQRLGRARATLDRQATHLLIQAVQLDPRGCAVVDRDALAGAADELALHALARIVTCLGGRVHFPRTARLMRALAALRSGQPQVLTLGGCRVAAGAGTLSVTREAAPIPDLQLTAGAAVQWDGRFGVLLHRAPEVAGPFFLRRLDDAAWGRLRGSHGEGIPRQLRPGLPVLCNLDGPLMLPHLPVERGCTASFTAEFRPRRPLVEPCFAPAGET